MAQVRFSFHSKHLIINLPPPDLGKVLAGVQVPPNEAAEFDDFLDKLGYPFVEETENPVYKRYLRG